MMHPHWYYDKYDKAFGRKNSYLTEARILLRQMHGFTGKVVEVGAGTGNHASAILALGVKTLVLMDIDPFAVNILKQRFSTDDRVTIVLGDGFRVEKSQWCNRIFAMYSLIQQVSNYDSLISRITGLVHQVRVGGTIAFEIIDRRVSQSIYPNGCVSKLYEGPDGWVDTYSRYPRKRIIITYTGQFDGQKLNYLVSLIELEICQLKKVLLTSGVEDIEIVALDDIGRRLLVSGIRERDLFTQ